jgi:hypothetical protein
MAIKAKTKVRKHPQNQHPNRDFLGGGGVAEGSLGEYGSDRFCAENGSSGVVCSL